jgi:hypothetical protein
MYRSRAKVDPYGTDCGVSSVSALHALFLWATRRARRVAFFRAAWKLHHWKNESDGQRGTYDKMSGVHHELETDHAGIF